MTDYDASSPANLLEPAAFADLFVAFPPIGFSCHKDSTGLPLFLTDFDLLTTLERQARNRITGLPLFKTWSRLFKFPTCFCGTTITEYAPLPANLSKQALTNLITRLKEEHGADRSLVIIKDLPLDSPLLPPEDNKISQFFAQEAKRQGFIEVQGQALASVPVDYADQEAYLARLSAGRRKDLRRKLKKKDALSIEALPLGDPLFFDTSFLERVYVMYLAVFQQSEIHFDLLSRDFFAALLQNKTIKGVVFLYHHKEMLAGYNICLLHRSLLIDKYIGFSYPLSRELNLYFISWMVNLAYAREKGCSAYIAGWTDPEVKVSLGASLSLTRHLVWIRNPVLRAILRRLRHLFEADSHLAEQ